MSLTVKNDGGERMVVPSGTYVARCYSIVDLGTQYSEKFGVWSHKVLLQFELPTELMDDGRPLAISSKYTLSLNEKANLRHILESWLGRTITEKEEKEGFALGSMLGAPCLLAIIHADSNGKTYANIAGVMSVPKGTAVPEQSNPMVSYDVENGKDAVFTKLPEWIRTIIEQSKEFKDGDEPTPEEAADTSMPFGDPEMAVPEEPAVPAEVYTWLESTFTRAEWLTRLHQAASGRFEEPTDMDKLNPVDLQAAGEIIIRKYLAMASGKKKAVTEKVAK